MIWMSPALPWRLRRWIALIANWRPMPHIWLRLAPLSPVECADAGHIDARADVLAQVISQQFGYAGDQASYNDMQNANLMQVIDRRKGLPVALGLLYIIAARAQGWACAGLNFPGHFLIRLELGSARRILDPFNGGVKMEIPQLRSLLKGMAGEGAELKPEYYQPVSNRDVLLRLLNNIKGRAFQSNDFIRASGILHRMRMIFTGCRASWV